VLRAFDDSTQHADHLQAADAALVEVGRRIAGAIDGTDDDDKALPALAGQMLAVVDRLGLSPKGRRQIDLDTGPEPEEVNPLDDLRTIRNARRAAQVESGT
jgi:hypothetical protein